ncbi:MAG: flagellin [Mesorhizobium sp.]
MSSIMTNSSALTALQSLNATNKALEATQSRISTGYRVAEAKDNAAYWSIATTMRSDNQANSVVQDALGLGAGKVDTAYAGMNKAIDAVNDLKKNLLAAYGASDADKAKIQTEIQSTLDQLASSTKGATYSGANWLSVDTSANATAGTFGEVKIVSSFNRDAAGAVSIGTIDIDVDSIKLYDAGGATKSGILDKGTDVETTTTTLNATGQASADAAGQTAYDDYITANAVDPDNPTSDETDAADAAKAAAIAGYVPQDGETDTTTTTQTFSVSALNVAGASDDAIKAMMSVVDTALASMTDAATVLGAASKRIDTQKEFTSAMMDAIDKGVGQLVDADMNKESTRLQALQVQQQLGIQALSIANGSSQSILSLFRG